MVLVIISRMLKWTGHLACKDEKCITEVGLKAEVGDTSLGDMRRWRGWLFIPGRVTAFGRNSLCSN
jgi:hypothetical protein